MDKLNLVWRYRIREKFPTEILDSLMNQGILGNCVIRTNKIDEEYVKTHKNIHVVPADFGFHFSNGDYEDIIDWNDLPALSQELMEAMLPYESMAIKLGMRWTSFPVALYETEKMQYHRHLRFWNYILDQYNINGMYFSHSPHFPDEYIMYGLAKARGIRTILAAPTSVADFGKCLFAYGDSIENLGTNIGDYYKTLDKAANYTLEGVAKKYFELHSKQNLDDIKKIENPGKDKKTVEIRNIATRQYFGGFWGKNSFLRETKSMVWDALKKVIGKPYSEEQHIQKIWNIKNVKYFKHHLMITQDKYNKDACNPDYTDKYIYFALQFTPEDTTMPRAGVFTEQYTSVQLLARCAMKKGIIVFVKEHPHLIFRDKRFYDILKKIKNVKLIKSNEATYDIIKNSIAVATQTGSCILEAILMKKPAIAIGSGNVWKELPGLYRIGNEEDGERALNEICSNPQINLDDVKRYFFAIQKNTISYSWQDANDESTTIYDEATIAKNIELIKMLMP